LFKKITERRGFVAKGQKYNEDIKERAWAMFAAYGNLSYISRHLKVPRSTITGWKHEFDRECESNDALAKLRNLKKQEFVVRAWQAVNLAQTLLEKALKHAEDGKKDIDVDKLIRVIGTLYDKQALANKEATEIVEGSAVIRKFEDFEEETEEEDT
jgi:hypothetical protein